MAAPTAVATGDSISTHQGSAYDGSAYQITSSLNHGVDTYNAATDVGGYLSLNTRPTGVGASLTERVRVTAAGSVGVGTTTPAASLEVMGSIASRNTKTVNTVANSRWFGGAYTGNLFTLAALDGANGNNNLQIGGGTAGGEPATQIQLFTGPAGALGVGTARMTISSTGLISDSSGNELGWKNIPPNTSGFVRNGCYCISANTAINAASAGDSYQLFNDTATSLSLTVGTGITTMRLSGTTSTGARTLLPYGKATIWFRAGDTPIVSGDVL
jgi:hypothetical protein